MGKGNAVVTDLLVGTAAAFAFRSKGIIIGRNLENYKTMINAAGLGN